MNVTKTFIFRRQKKLGDCSLGRLAKLLCQKTHNYVLMMNYVDQINYLLNRDSFLFN